MTDPKLFPRLLLCLLLAGALAACDSGSDDDPLPDNPPDGDPGLRCAVPSLGDVADGRFALEYEFNGDFEEHAGEAVFGFVEHEGATHFVLHFVEPAGENDGVNEYVVSVTSARADLPDADTYSVEFQRPWTLGYSTGGGGGSVGGDLTLRSVGDDEVVGTFAGGYNFDSDVSESMCIAFEATRSDDIDPEEVRF